MITSAVRTENVLHCTDVPTVEGAQNGTGRVQWNVLEDANESHVLIQTRNTSATTLFDWLFATVSLLNSNTSETIVPSNNSVRTEVVVGKIEYTHEAYTLDASASDVELNCDFVSGVLGIMKKLELGSEALEEVSSPNCPGSQKAYL